MGSSNKEIGPFKSIATFFGVVLAIWAVIFFIALVTSRATPSAGQIGVVRTGTSLWWAGAWFNGHNIRQVIEPGSGSTFTGLGSETHWYPANSSQRYYTITADTSRGDRPGVDVVEVPTSDGVRAGLEGTFYFNTAFDGTKAGDALLKDFDNHFGVRTFPLKGGDAVHPWDGNQGWEAFLDTVVRPIIENDLRRAIARVTCAQLVSSCALVHSQSVSALKNAGGQNVAQIQRVQEQINSTLQQDIRQTLGQDYFASVRFLLAKVALPTRVQDEIDKAQSQFAAVGTAQAEVQQAKLQSQANSEKQNGYKNCPACAQIDELKAIPPNVQTYAPGGNFAVTK